MLISCYAIFITWPGLLTIIYLGRANDGDELGRIHGLLQGKMDMINSGNWSFQRPLFTN